MLDFSELRPEKTVPHKDTWMETLYGSGFKHFGEQTTIEEHSSNFVADYFATGVFCFFL
jgi:hypothetical protein